MHHKTTLPNGLRVVTEEIPSLFSASIGIWVMCGSRYEQAEERGISHFIEHLLFKGTTTRTAQDIAREIDSLGGILNAFTSKEHTCFYAKVLDHHLPTAIELLADAFQNSTFPPEEMEREREVILQEIHQVQDTPDDFIHDLFYQSLYKGHPLGWPIAGTEEIVSKLTRDDLMTFMSRTYSAGRVIVSAAGNITHGKVLDLLGRYFSLPHEQSTPLTFSAPAATSPLSVNYKELEQVHCCLGVKGLPSTHPQRHAFHLLSTVLGGGMSSRLFQEIREKRGWAYSIYSYVSSYHDTGILGVYFASGEERVKDILLLIAQSLEEIADILVPEEELVRAKDQTKGHLLLSMESSDSRMSKLAKGEMYFGRFVPIEETIAGIESVTPEDIRTLARELFRTNNLCTALLGPIREENLPLDRLALKV